MAKQDNLKVISNLPFQIRKLNDDFVTEVMQSLGDSALDDYVNGHLWNNRTFNLEDSIGYAVYVDGVKKSERFLNESEKASTGNKLSWKAHADNGTVFKGRDEAENFIKNYKPTKRYELIVVAGMFYAAWLEALHGLDVLTNSYQAAKDNSPKEFKNIATYYSNKTKQ